MNTIKPEMQYLTPDLLAGLTLMLAVSLQALFTIAAFTNIAMTNTNR